MIRIAIGKRSELVFCVISGCSQIGRISRTMATLKTSQDPLYEASEHCEDTLQRRREISQLIGSKCRSVATHNTWSKRPLKCRGFGAVVTGCTEGFSGTENYKENAVKTRNSITKFSTLESVMKLKLFCI